MPKIRLFAAVIIGLIAVSSFAATRTWTGVTNANWSEATNWSPTGVPNTNDTLAFDTVFQHADMNNDLPLGTRIGAISFTGSPHCSVSGNPLVLAGPVTGDAFIRWAVDLKMDTDLALPGIGFTGIDVNGHSVVIRSLRTKPFGFPPASIDGLITGSGTLTFDGIPAKINKSGDFRGAVYMNSDLVLAGSMPEAEFVIGTFRTLSG